MDNLDSNFLEETHTGRRLKRQRPKAERTMRESSIERFQRAAEARGLRVEIRTMAQSTHTAEQAAAACGCALGQIVKSLIFRTKIGKHPILVLVSGVHKVDVAKLEAAVGSTLERADAAFVRDTTGFAIGGVPPFGHATPLKTFLDEALLSHALVYAAAGNPLAIFSIEPETLVKATGAFVSE
jgi:prolyl-tRNA editing enzyme YbaK/EbsC (Cys-tRNA(Pro) deacylase)